MASDWTDAGNTLQSLAERFRELGAAPPDEWNGLPAEEVYESMRRSEARVRIECDFIMRALLDEDDLIGTPSPLQAYFCSMRTSCALDTLRLFNAELSDCPLYPCPPEEWSSAELLEWLLVTNWEQRHDAWVKTAALAFALGLRNYPG